MRNKRFLLTQLMKLSFQSLMYIMLFLSFFAILSQTNPQIINLSRTAATTMATFVVIIVILRIVYGGYDIEDKKPRSVFASILITTLMADVVTYFQLQIMNVNPANNDRLILFGEDFWLLCGAIVLQIGIIYFFATLGNRLYFKINPPQKSCVITSSQELALHVAEKMSSFRKKFFLNDVVHYECPDMEATIREHEVIFLAGIPDTEEAQLKNLCYSLNKAMYLLAELDDVIISTAQQSILDDTPFLYIHRSQPTLMQLFCKRCIDILASLLGLALLSPLMLATALVLLFSRGGPVFFRQKRATIHGRVFEIIKFRTMYQEDPQSGPVSALENDSRITPVGGFLRKYRLDEIPQLFNVLKGDMSMVGPRPEMLENVHKYEQEVPEFKYRQQMKAGLTGLAQIDGKYNTSPKDKAILDLMYIENFSLSMDLKLLLRTLTIFFRRDSAEGFVLAKRIACPRMRTQGEAGAGAAPAVSGKVAAAKSKPEARQPQEPVPEKPVRAAL